VIREKIKQFVAGAIKKLQENNYFPGFEIPDVLIEHPENASLGDYATNISLKLVRDVKKNPLEIAESIKAEILKKNSDFFEKIEIANPGFINFFISPDYLQKQVEEINKKKSRYSQLEIGKGKKVQIEFISANPTGPLHVGNGRGGFCGDVLANILNRAGYEAKREYYVNNMGRQMKFLENSLLGKEPGYKSPYIDELKKKGEKNPQKAAKFIVGKIMKTTANMGIKYDKWFYESDLTKDKEKVLSYLKKKNLVYEKDNALWFKSTEFGDDKDRVLIRSEEKAEETYSEETYFLSDIAYLKNRFERGFDKIIIFLGAEHHGYVGRLKAGAAALGYDKDKIITVIFQLVKLVQEGKEVKMSKRTGAFVTLDELLDEVGKDVSRFLFLTRSYGNHLVFDLDLAKEQSENNPVYYVQYAHARICSILKKSQIKKIGKVNLNLLKEPPELALIKKFMQLPEIIEDTAKDYQVQRLPQYALDLAAIFHHFYRDCRVISEDKELSKARLSLVLATKTVLKDVLDLMGISAPEKM